MSDYSEPTKFNMALSTLERMNEVLRRASYYGELGELVPWYSSLFELRRMVAAFIKKDQFDSIETLFKDINEKPWMFPGTRKVFPGKYNLVANKLDTISIEMGVAMKAAGILMPVSDDPRLALTSGSS